jgi:hypothetical protein
MLHGKKECNTTHYTPHYQTAQYCTYNKGGYNTPTHHTTQNALHTMSMSEVPPTTHIVSAACAGTTSHDTTRYLTQHSAHDTTLHYTTLHHTTRHYTTPHHTALTYSQLCLGGHGSLGLGHQGKRHTALPHLSATLRNRVIV